MDTRCRLRSAGLAAPYGAAAAAAATLAIGAAGATEAVVGATRHCNVILGVLAAGACCASNRKLFQAGMSVAALVLTRLRRAAVLSCCVCISTASSAAFLLISLALSSRASSCPFSSKSSSSCKSGETERQSCRGARWNKIRSRQMNVSDAFDS